MDVEGEEPNRILVVCVDRDDDLGSKAGLSSPILGREACLKAATKLAIADPEEADANAIFASIKEFDELRRQGYSCQVAILTGSPKRGIEADQKIRQGLQSILSNFKANGLVLVSDGMDDVEVLPVIQSLLPVVSVRRVIIRHSKSVEESYAVLGRYLRMLAFDPRYSRFALGVPGVLLLLTGILTFLGYAREAFVFALSLLGGALIVRGFDLDKALSSMKQMTPSGYVRVFTLLASTLVLIVAAYQSFIAVSQTPEYSKVIANPQLILKYGPFLTGLFIREAINITYVGLGIYFGGALLYHWLRQSLKIWRDMVGLVMLGILYLPILQFSLILINPNQLSAFSLISSLLFGMAGTLVVVMVVYRYIRSQRRE